MGLGTEARSLSDNRKVELMMLSGPGGNICTVDRGVAADM
jgi:hypothetical protein